MAIAIDNIQFKISEDIVYIRRTEDDSSDIVGITYRGYVVVATKKSDDGSWYYIPFYSGWISSAYIVSYDSNDDSTTIDASEILKTAESITSATSNTINTANNTTSNGISSFLTNNLSGIYGIPYQFDEFVDRRLDGMDFGRIYAEKIIGRMPLLFLTPGKQSFLSNYKDKNDASSLLNALADIGFGNTVDSSLIDDIKSRDGRYYTFDFAYDDYFKYVNPMCNNVAVLMGIGDQQITIGGYTAKLSVFDWKNALNSNFKSYFSASENIVFYVDSLNSISESFSNETRESSLASTINGLSDSTKEIQFLLGSGEEIAAMEQDNFESTMSSINDVINSYVKGKGVLSGIAGNITTILSGGKLVFPEMWSDSSFGRSYNISIKLRSPDCDNVSLYLNLLVPYIHLLCMTAPRGVNNNGFSAPFMVRGFYKGLFNIDMGIITDLSVTKGKEGSWNDNGIPTEMDIDITIKDLYQSMFITDNSSPAQFVNNTALMDYLANMAGINLSKPEIERQLMVYAMLSGSKVVQTPGRLWSSAEAELTNLLAKLYSF